MNIDVDIYIVLTAILTVLGVVSCVILTLRQYFIRKELLSGNIVTTYATIYAYHLTNNNYEMYFYFTDAFNEKIRGHVVVNDIKYMHENYPFGTEILIKYNPKKPRLAWKLVVDLNNSFVKKSIAGMVYE